MTIRRFSPYLHATWIAKALVGEKNCLWSYWYKSNNQGYAKAHSDFDSARWMMAHTELLNELAEQLEQQGCKVFIEHQNGFRSESPRSGVVISGTPDIIAVHPDGRAVIYDVKTGQPGASHHRAGATLHVPCAQGPGQPLEGSVLRRRGRVPRRQQGGGPSGQR